MPEDDALHFSDSIGRTIARVLVDQGVSISDSIQTGVGMVIQPPTATAHAVALAAEVKATASLESVVTRRDEARSVQVGLDAEKALWVMFAIALGDLFDRLTTHSVPPADALVIVAAVAGLCFTSRRIG
jgi:hypothetical protein